MQDKVIWMFREQRSGSSWASFVIPPKLKRAFRHLDRMVDDKDDTKIIGQVFKKFQNEFTKTDTVYSTHLFKLLPSLVDVDNLYLIRTTRRNKIEQILSLIYMNTYLHGLTHYYVDQSKNQQMKHFENTLLNPVIVLKQEVLKSCQTFKRHEDLWNEYGVHHDNFVLVYEDCEQGITIDDLGIDLKWSNDDQYTYKLPEYKSKAFQNYDQIVDWCNDFLAKNQFVQY